MMPKIPLTTTTRNLALQSDDALVEVETSSSSEDDYGANNRNNGTLRMRRSATDEKIKQRVCDPLFQPKINDILHLDPPAINEVELPLPPPPQVMTSSLSSLSLNSLPPPPAEFLNSPESEECDLSSSSITPVSSPAQPVTPNSPQSPSVPPKPVLLHRSESLMERSNMYQQRLDQNNAQNGFCQQQNGHVFIDRKVVTTDSKSVSFYGTTPRIKNGNVYLGIVKHFSQDDTHLQSCPAPVSLPNGFPTNNVQTALQFQQPQFQQPPQPACSAQQAIYSSNHINSQTYTKSKICYSPPAPSQRSPMKGPLPPPPEQFLHDIQRVMEKKWKVAQQLSMNTSATPLEVYGFRDPAYLPSLNDSYNIYDTVATNRKPPFVSMVSAPSELPVNGKHHERHHRPPPPPPKRNEKTQLSQRPTTFNVY